MEVRIIPLGGCLNVFLGVVTLGVAPLSKVIVERSWPKTLDEQGVVTRGGKRIAWNEFTKVVKVITHMRTITTERYELRSPKGKVTIVPYRLVDGQAVWQYAQKHLPDAAKSV
jgi:hypothetical protein